MLHGTNSDGRASFGPSVQFLSDQRSVVLVDYAGCGESTIPEGELTLELLVEQAAAVIRDSGSAPADLLGFSLGAVVAAATAAKYPELVRRLVLIAGWPSIDARHRLVFETWSRLESLDPELGVRYGLSLAFSADFLSRLGHERIAQLLTRKFPGGTRQRIDLGGHLDIRGDLWRVRAPTLVVGLTLDTLVPIRQVRALREAIPGSFYEEIESGHVVFLEKPDEIVRIVREFVLADGSDAAHESMQVST